MEIYFPIVNDGLLSDLRKLQKYSQYFTLLVDQSGLGNRLIIKKKFIGDGSEKD